MYHVANQILHDSYLAEDAVSESLIKIAKNYSKIPAPVCQETKRFVVIVTERTAIDYHRKLNRTESVSFERDLGDCIFEMQPSAEIGLYEAIDLLPSNYREVILLKFGTGMSNKEISQITSYSISKIEKLISRGKKKLESLLAEVNRDEDY